jgi:hypothetical protein
LYASSKEFVKAKICARRFLSRMSKFRWLKPFIIARGGISGDPEAIALNCLGLAELNQSEYGIARDLPP